MYCHANEPSLFLAVESINKEPDTAISPVWKQNSKQCTGT